MGSAEQTIQTAAGLVAKQLSPAIEQLTGLTRWLETNVLSASQIQRNGMRPSTAMYFSIAAIVSVVRSAADTCL